MNEHRSLAYTSFILLFVCLLSALPKLAMLARKSHAHKQKHIWVNACTAQNHQPNSIFATSKLSCHMLEWKANATHRSLAAVQLAFLASVLCFPLISQFSGERQRDIVRTSRAHGLGTCHHNYYYRNECCIAYETKRATCDWDDCIAELHMLRWFWSSFGRRYGICYILHFYL